MIVTFHPPPHVTLPLSGSSAARAGRRGIESLLVDADADGRASAVLITSELVTNAIQAASGCTLSAWYLPDQRAIRIEVADTSLELPVMQQPESQRVGGYGLRIVNQLTTRWGVAVNEDYKIVWAEIAATSPTQRSPR